ncbi:hypothetical protein [Legionella brunensis]|uniref:Uncharacterized protein n=1 Tax=Legionella brunensis TaxID=29422 RepID=A0A0W0S4I6_9GAMM|nr:hypothetical protein [Legionella brunensis]KTC78414.1 hypothetical protein Lbru_2706 [Legionella brunensis]
MIDFIDKKRFFGKKTGIEAPGVAPKTSGSVKGKWVWYRPREENEENISKQRVQDHLEYQKATDSERQKQLYLLKTGAIKFNTKEDFSINNVRNRVEVANSWLLNFFLGEGSAVQNTIAYSTYHKEKNDYDFKYYIDENGFVKEELASQYAGQFDTPKGKKTEAYNKEKLQELNFAPLRKAFVVCGLMGFHDFLGNYDNFAFIKNKLMITDTGVGSGNTGQHTTYVSAGKTNFDDDVLKDLDLLLANKKSELVSEFRSHLTIEDVIKGIEDLKTKGKEELFNILEESFKPIPNPFKENDKRYAKFVSYNEALQFHKGQLYVAYSNRIDSLVQFQDVLGKFYDANPEKYHVPSFKTLAEVDRKLTEQKFFPKFYKIFADVHEKAFSLEQKKGPRSNDEEQLYSTMQAILTEFNAKDIDGDQIEMLLQEAIELEEKMAFKKESLRKFDEISNELIQSLPKKWQHFLSTYNPHVKATDPEQIAVMQLNHDIGQIRALIDSGKYTLEDAKSSLFEATKNVIKVSNEQQEKTSLGKTHKVFGLSIQLKGSNLASALRKFLESKHFVEKEPLDKHQLVELPSSKYKQKVSEMKNEEQNDIEQNYEI